MKALVLVASAATACSFPDVTFALDAGDASMDMDATQADADMLPETSTVDVMVDPEAGCIDRDHDGYFDKFTTCDAGTATDCDDYDPGVNPGVKSFVFLVPDGGNRGLSPYPNGDWNCDDMVEYQYPQTLTSGQCGLGNCMGAGFTQTTACGEVGSWGNCSNGALCGYASKGPQTQGCM